MSNNNSPSSFINLPKGGGAINGMGEKFSPDLFTGTGNFSVPIALPPGRNGLQPQLSLGYSTGNGNGAFGLGWGISIPGVSRKISGGLPRYQDETPEQSTNELKKTDTFILSGAEDLVPIHYNGREHFIEYRPRTEGLFAMIRRYISDVDDYWQVKTNDGLISWYGTPGKKGDDPAAVFDISNPTRVFSWMLCETQDAFGNRILYDYLRDNGADSADFGRSWNQLYLQRIRYLDYKDATGTTQFLVNAEFEYEDRVDAFSAYQSGFEIRTRFRCQAIKIYTQPEGQKIHTRTLELAYQEGTYNRISLLSRISVTGHDGPLVERMPALEFSYSDFSPVGKRYRPVRGRELPPVPISQPGIELVDLNGNGLPDILQMDGTVRYWSNLGNGVFDIPREMRRAPAGLSLGDPGVVFMDINGDGRADLVVLNGALSGYFPTTFKNEWDSRSFRKFRQAPTFDIQDPGIRLVDMNGDGVTDVLRSGSRLEVYLNDPEDGWQEVLIYERKNPEDFPDVNFSDPRVHLADMSGDGQQDIVLVHNGNVEYWPNLGRGKWGRRIAMHNSPRFPQGYNPRRILLGDVAGDGWDDIIYIDNGKLLLWVNQNGNAFSDPVEITGIPFISDTDAVRLVDLYGTGVSGVLFTMNQTTPGRDHWFFLDLTANTKPYLLREMNNNIGAITKVAYKPSTYYYLQDYQNPNTRWETPLPFPVLVVAQVEVIDAVSQAKFSTEYRYHHGYWDGVEREFRGFGMVEQLDSEIFEVFSGEGLHGSTPFINNEQKYFSPPLLTKSWFHQGPIDREEGDWGEPDRAAEYWKGDPQLLRHTEQVNDFLRTLPSAKYRREALRALRGSLLRTELYALDGSPRQSRPYTVTEQAYGLMEIEAPVADSKRRRIFFPFSTAQRTTQWERSEDPMTTFNFTEDYDAFGQPRTSVGIACPRTWRNLADIFPETRPFLATVSRTDYAYSLGESPYIKNCVARSTSWELKHRGNLALYDLKNRASDTSSLELIGQSITYFDGEAFTGLPFGQIGAYGAPVRAESLIITEDILRAAWTDEHDTAQVPAWLQTGIDWPEEYPQAFRDEMPPLGGYNFHDGSGPQARGFWVQGIKTRYDFHVSTGGRGLTLAQRDTLDRETSVEYDLYQYLPERVTDPLGLVQRAWYDYRVLQPFQAEDPNGSRSRFRFSPLGLATAFYINGREGEMPGDSEEKPSRRLEYDFFAFVNRGEPIFGRSIAREYHAHDSDVPPVKLDDTITTVEYSDGFGRVVQTRVQAEDILFGDEQFGTGILPADIEIKPGASIGRVRPSGDAENVVVSGWKIYNNKGLVVQQYEPYYDRGFGYATPEDYQYGKKVEMFYDPRGQAIRTVNPDGSEQRIIYGIPASLDNPDAYMPTPWEAFTYDANDLAPRCIGPDGISLSARAPEEHHFTPSSIEIDAMGRTIRAVQRNRPLRNRPDDPLPLLEEYTVRSNYDIRGNLLTVTDALGRLAFRYTYDLTFDKENGSRVWRNESIDAGLRRIAYHALGMEAERRDSKGSITLTGHDRGRRLVGLWARNHPGEPLTLRQRLIYGDTLPPDELFAGSLGRLVRHYDEAGVVEVHGYDFKGNVRANSRRTIRNEVIRPYLGTVDYTTFFVDWSRPDADAYYLETTAYRIDMEYDALNRAKRILYPEVIDGERKVLLPAYNRAGALESIRFDGPAGSEAPGALHLAYNARGQRTLLALANDLMTRYEYDPETFRLTRLRTERYRLTDANAYVPDGGLLQDLAYRYDLAGNITQIQDRGTGKGINGIFPIDRDYTYDAIYRLLSGTGIEHDAYVHTGEPWLQIMQHHNNDLTRARRYRQQYAYDPAGNLLELGHRNLQGEAGHYTRTFSMVNGNNRLATLEQGGITYRYVYDTNGNMIREATNRHYCWNYADQLVRFRNKPEDAAPTVDACYLYGADGIRVKKLVLNGAAVLKTTTYISEVFEHHTCGQEENNTLHLMDGDTRLALWRIGSPLGASDENDPAVQYQLGDHLGNSSMAAGANGALIHREEFTPYGETSFGGYARKRYRYTGMERDEESGLHYHRARYYLPVLCRWGTSDPIGVVSGANLFQYNKSNPILYIDVYGLNPEKKLGSVDFENTIPTNTSYFHKVYFKKSSLPKGIRAKNVTLVFLDEENLSSPALRDVSIPGEPHVTYTSMIQLTFTTWDRAGNSYNFSVHVYPNKNGYAELSGIPLGEKFQLAIVESIKLNPTDFGDASVKICFRGGGCIQAKPGGFKFPASSVSFLAKALGNTDSVEDFSHTTARFSDFFATGEDIFSLKVQRDSSTEKLTLSSEYFEEISTMSSSESTLTFSGLFKGAANLPIVKKIGIELGMSWSKTTSSSQSRTQGRREGITRELEVRVPKPTFKVELK